MKITEAAPFPEIWAKLDKYERKEIISAIQGTGATINPQTVKNWATGKNKPPMPLVRDTIATVVSRVLGIEISSKTLFS